MQATTVGEAVPAGATEGGRQAATGLSRNHANGRLRRPLGVAALVAALLLVAGCAPTIDRPARFGGAGAAGTATGPDVAPRFAGKVFITADGSRLPLRQWLPAGPVKAVVLALHGFDDYSHAFAMPAEAWARNGIAVYAYDQRGFGAAPGRGRWPGTAVLVDDAATACGILRRLYPDVPLYLVGESMGGAVAIVAMTGEAGTPVPDVDGVILVSPAVWSRSSMGLVPRAALWLGVRLMPGMTLTGRSLHIVASDNMPMLRGLARDPLVIKATRIDTIYGLVNLMDKAAAAAPKLNGRLLVLEGKKDPIVPHAAACGFLRKLPKDPPDPPTLALYPQGYHMLFRDLDGPTVIADAAGWMLDPGAPLISGADRGAAQAFLLGTARPPAAGG
jgi:acylglycerol lipase